MGLEGPDGLGMQRPDDDQPIELTEQELAGLKPKAKDVVNPWIHEQTHQEYLVNVTVSADPLLAARPPPPRRGVGRPPSGTHLGASPI